MATFLRIWQLRPRRRRCRTCRKPLLLVLDDRGRTLPFRVDAKPIRTETSSATGARFDVYEATAFHSTVCVRAKKKRARTDGAKQARLL